MTTTDALFTIPAVTGGVRQAVETQLAALTDKGLLGPEHAAIAAAALRVAEISDREVKGYAIAQAVAELRNCLDALPKPQAGDVWTILSSLLTTTAPGPDMPAPAYATAPTPGAPHHADAVAVVSQILGTPLIPWQRFAARIITERTLDDSRWRYPLVLVTVPRQSGKTTVLGTIFTQRSITRPGSRIKMTAQTGKDAAARWKDLVKHVTLSPLGPFTQVRQAAGTQALTFVPSDSTISPFPPTKTSVHGDTITDAAIDEAFAFSEAEGADLLGAISPAMATIDDSQTIIISTAGNPESTWLKELVDKGRQSTKQKNPTMAYIEFSIPNGDLAQHPAAGWTQSIEQLEALASSLPPVEYRRAILNQWVESTADPLFNPGDWRDQLVTDPTLTDNGTTIGLAYDVSFDRSRATLVAVWEVPGTDQVCHHMVAGGHGTHWLIGAIHNALIALGPRAVLCADDGGEARQVTDALRKDGITVTTLTARDFTSACSAWLARVREGRIINDDVDGLVAHQAAGARTRILGDGWAISRRHSTGPVDAIIASAVATRIIDTTVNTPPPFIATLGDIE